MLKKRTFKSVASMFLALCMIVSIFSASAIAAFAEDDIVIEASEGLDAVPPPIDPQSWKLQEDMLWEEMAPNPAINWMTDLNEDGLVNMQRNLPGEKINGAVILVDYWDRPFVTTQPLNSDLLGYYLLDEYGNYEDKITKNPIMHVDASEYTQWLADYLNVNSEANNDRSIDEYWRENSYGKWAIELDAFGPFTLSGMEFEYSPSYSTYADFPPTFRRGASGTSGSRNLVNESIALAQNSGIYLGDYDFFFILHAGYDESNVWYEFGMMQWSSPQEVPYEYGPGAKMEQIEDILTKNPELLLQLETTTVSLTNNTPVINGYNQNTVLKDEIAKIKAMKEAGTLSQYEFKFPQADWDWTESYAWGNASPTRYVEWTSWIAAMSSWSSSSSATVPMSPANGGGSRTIRYSQQGESDGMGTFAHEFGHIVSHSDNYEATMWTQNVSPKTDYWDLMARGDKIGPGGYHARWTIPSGQEAGGSPGHMMMFPKIRSNYYDDGDIINMSVAELKTKTPFVANIVSRNIPLNNNKNADNENKGYYPFLDAYGLYAPNFYKGINLEFDAENPDKATVINTGWSWTRFAAGRMGIEVVDRTGYESFAADHGVLLSRLQSGANAQNRMLIDSHLYDINLVDYYFDGEPVYYCIGHADQLNDALFHAGTSTTDTGYYEGSMRQWEPQNGRPVVSGNTVNEFYDNYNGIHVYILENNLNPGKYGEVLSYQVALLHDDGVAVGGALEVSNGKLTTALPGNVAVVEYTVKNTGDATDIVRITLGGDLAWETTLNNNLFAVGAGETITVPVYITIPEVLGKVANQSLTFTASSESNAAKTTTKTIENIADKASVLALELNLDKVYIKAGDYFNVKTSVTKVVDSNAFVLDLTFDKTLIEYANRTLPTGVELLSYESTETGARLILMAQNYDVKDLVTVMFYAKADLEEMDELLLAVGTFAVKVDDGKELLVLSSKLGFDPPIDPSLFDLILLSNTIDLFGKTKSDPNWPQYKGFDFDRNGVIDIRDITFVANNLK